MKTFTFKVVGAGAALFLAGAHHGEAIQAKARRTSVEHGGDEPYEWGGMFEVTDENAIWIAQKVNEAYADDTMTMVLIPTTSTSDEDFEAAEETAHELLEAGGCTAKISGDTITPSSSECFELTFNIEDYESKFIIDVTTTLAEGTGLAIYTQHVPTEFEANSHYYRDEEGHDIEPVHETGEEEAEAGGSLGMVVFGCFIVTIITFSGIVVLACSSVSQDKYHGPLHAFAAGALLSCAAYLLLIESMHMVSAEEWADDDENAEVAYTWRWGTALLAGFIAPLCFQFICSNLGCDVAHLARGEKTTQDIELATKAPAVETSDLDTTKNTPKSPLHDNQSDNGNHELTDGAQLSSSVLVGICIGDFMHNFTDGVLIGTAFKLCSSSVAWGIIFSTCAHEVAQEIGDYIMLTTAPVSLSPVRALALNFVVGLSCVLGGIIAYEADVSEGANGLLLVFGAGNYIYLGASVALTEATKANKTNLDTAHVLLAFFVGAVAIAIILLEHGHCVPEGGAHDHR